MLSLIDFLEGIQQNSTFNARMREGDENIEELQNCLGEFSGRDLHLEQFFFSEDRTCSQVICLENQSASWLVT
jgi:hypothetical protein